MCMFVKRKSKKSSMYIYIVLACFLYLMAYQPLGGY